MKWIRHWFPTKEQKIFLAAADEAFVGVCGDASTAAEIYGKYPAIKARDRKTIRHDLIELTNTADPSELSRRLRGAFASVVELLVLDHFYTNLEVDDREHFAKLIGSTRKVQDQNYYFSIAHDYAFAGVLEFIIFNGWVGTGLSKSELKKLQVTFIDTCKAHCESGLVVAKASAQGQVITETEKENIKTAVMLKEVARRALAGEQVFDE